MTTTKTTIKTIKDAIPEYLKKLEKEGKSKSTRYTVELDLGYLMKHLGDKKELQKILTVHISNFYKSDFVNKTKDRQRSIHTINQIKRIVRQFLVWTKDKKYIDNLPIPKDEMKFVIDNKEKAKQKAKAKKEADKKAKELAKAKKETEIKIAEKAKEKQNAKKKAKPESKEQKPADNKPAVENKKEEVKTESDNKTNDAKNNKPSENKEAKKTSTIIIGASNKPETTAQPAN